MSSDTTAIETPASAEEPGSGTVKPTEVEAFRFWLKL